MENTASETPKTTGIVTSSLDEMYRVTALRRSPLLSPPPHPSDGAAGRDRRRRAPARGYFVNERSLSTGYAE